MIRRAQACPVPIATGILMGDGPGEFIKCEICGHMIDMRILGEVFEHEGPHLPPEAQ